MNPCVIIFSLLLLSPETTTGNPLVAVEGGGGDDTNGVITKCFDNERDALFHFKAPLQDLRGTLSRWTAGDNNCCIWTGVKCDIQTGHVTELELISSGLVGEISASLLNLTYLNYLDLSFNSFHGTIPTFIGSLTELRVLDLRYNNFNGTIPSSIGSLTELWYLDLGINNLSGTIPSSIGSLTKLWNLCLSWNSLNGTIPTEFGNLTNLHVLYLRDVGRCRVENIEWLSHLSHIRELDMAGISLAKANQWVNVISSLQKLTHLWLEGCELSHVMNPYSPSFLNSSSSLAFLYLGNNSLTSSMYSWLLPLTSDKLRHIDLSSNMLDGIPKYFGNLCGLEHFDFCDNSAVVIFSDFLNNLSGCTSFISELDASHSQLTGPLSDKIKNFPYLGRLSVFDNQLNGTLNDTFFELPNLVDVDLSKNSLELVPSPDLMSDISSSSVQFFNMGSCKLGPRFPKWIQNLQNLTRLDISNTGISDTIPMGFWDTWPSQLTHLNLSSNNISGMAPDLSSNFYSNSVVDLSSNNFSGPILNVSDSLELLNLSKNKFYGGISFLCQIDGISLKFLDLSDNFLTGQLPDCLCNFKNLIVLNLGNNNLYGRLPPSVGCMIKLKALYLYNNNFYGDLPLSLKNCENLDSLNLEANKFSGNVPIWIGENLIQLYVLILRSNNFVGVIPLEICQLPYLQIVDLSRNNLHGTIPLCFKNLTSMVQEGLLPTQNGHFYSSSHAWHGLTTYFDHASIEWQGVEREFIRRNLGLLKSIDLSSNNLTGHIPYELANLYELVNLNLSKNALLGEIPHDIGQMKKLLVLDLSRNNLSGGIPSSMTQMTSLGYLNVSWNDLSGRIPSSTQLQSFEPSRYEGNSGLCGLPLTKKCPGDEEVVVGKSEGNVEGIDELERWFYIGGATGFPIGFWVACGTLLVNRRGRHAFFRFYDSFKDWVYVKVVVFITNLHRVRNT